MVDIADVLLPVSKTDGTYPAPAGALDKTGHTKPVNGAESADAPADKQVTPVSFDAELKALTLGAVEKRQTVGVDTPAQLDTFAGSVAGQAPDFAPSAETDTTQPLSFGVEAAVQPTEQDVSKNPASEGLVPEAGTDISTPLATGLTPASLDQTAPVFGGTGEAASDQALGVSALSSSTATSILPNAGFADLIATGPSAAETAGFGDQRQPQRVSIEVPSPLSNTGQPADAAIAAFVRSEPLTPEVLQPLEAYSAAFTSNTASPAIPASAQGPANPTPGAETTAPQPAIQPVTKVVDPAPATLPAVDTPAAISETANALPNLTDGAEIAQSVDTQRNIPSAGERSAGIDVNGNAAGKAAADQQAIAAAEAKAETAAIDAEIAAVKAAEKALASQPVQTTTASGDVTPLASALPNQGLPNKPDARKIGSELFGDRTLAQNTERMAHLGSPSADIETPEAEMLDRAVPAFAESQQAKQGAKTFSKPFTPATLPSAAAPITLESLAGYSSAMGIDQISGGLQALMPGGLDANAIALGAPATAATAAAAMRQVAVSMTKNAKAGTESFGVRLDPPELGRVSVKLTFADGRVSADISAERPETLNLLQRDQKALERALENAGQDVEKGGLTFSLDQHDGQSAGRAWAEDAQEAMKEQQTNGVTSQTFAFDSGLDGDTGDDIDPNQDFTDDATLAALVGGRLPLAGLDIRV